MDIDDDNNDDDKPDCPFGKSCYRQNPQHKRDFKH
jgi:aprataxin and PNK-like factor